jgi:hypothetical protein
MYLFRVFPACPEESKGVFREKQLRGGSYIHYFNIYRHPSANLLYPAGKLRLAA